MHSKNKYSQKRKTQHATKQTMHERNQNAEKKTKCTKENKMHNRKCFV